jgi:hypothetical protein
MGNVRAATTRIRPATSAPMIGRAAKQAARSFLAVMSGDENNYGVLFREALPPCGATPQGPTGQINFGEVDLDRRC